MQIPPAPEVFPRLFEYEVIDSTNLELKRKNLEALEEFSAVIAMSQTAGRGRLGRTWQSPSGSSLSLSVLLKPTSAAEFSWVTLIAALAISQTAGQLGVEAKVKWPNDVLVQGKKLSGVLASLENQNVILGIGVNIRPWEGQLHTSTNLEVEGVNVSAKEFATLIGATLRSLIASFRSNPSSLQSEFRANCVTIGQQVRAELPSGKELYGLAQTVNDSGQLVILSPEPIALSAADVWHLRN